MDSKFGSGNSLIYDQINICIWMHLLMCVADAQGATDIVKISSVPETLELLRSIETDIVSTSFIPAS